MIKRIKQFAERFWKWLIAIVFGGVVLASGFGGTMEIPIEYQLKVNKEDVIASVEVGDNVKYAYISDEAVENKKNEILEKRTFNTRYFRGKAGKTIMEVSLGKPYYKKGDDWFYIKIDEIPKAHFQEQTKENLISRIIATVWAIDVDEQVGVDEDDGGTVGGSWGLYNNWQSFGYDWNSADKSGFRFQTVAIPNGATIDAAYIEVKCASAGSGTVNAKVYGEDADDCATFSTEANFDGRSTTGGVDWDVSSAWSADSWYQSSSLTTAIGNITSRGGWATGQDLCILIKDDGTSSGNYRYYYDYSSGSANAAKLHVEYTVSGELISNKIKDRRKTIIGK